MRVIQPSPVFAETLSELPLFASLSPELRKTFLHCATIVSCEPGEEIFKEGEPAEGFFILKTGRVKMRRISPSGHEVVLHLASPPHMVGCRGLTLPGSKYPADAVAVDPVIALRFTREKFMRELSDAADVFFGLLVDLNRRLSEIYTLQSALQEPVEQRIAILLLNHALPQDFARDNWENVKVREVRITKSLIASIVGTTTETTIRILSKWKKRGIITSERGKIMLQDPEAVYKLTLKGELPCEQSKKKASKKGSASTDV